MISVGLIMLVTYSLIPNVRITAEQAQSAVTVMLLPPIFCALVIYLTTIASKSSNGWWTAAAEMTAAANVYLTPWIVCTIVESPASIAMPPLMFSFWASIAAMGFLLAIKLGRIKPASVATSVVGGSVGLAGFVLLVTQFATSASGHETTVPLFPTLTTASTVPAKALLNEEMILSVSYDDGFVQRAYVDKGFLRVSRPAYFRSVKYTVYGTETPDLEVSGRTELPKTMTYLDVQQSLWTMGLVKSLEPGFKASEIERLANAAR